jgi:hypothetical protein
VCGQAFDVGDEFAVPDRVVIDGKLEEPVEQQPSIARTARLNRKTNSFR